MRRRPKTSARGRKRGDPGLLASLAAGKPTAALAAETGLSERTIRRRRNDPEVIAARAAMVERVIDELADSSVEAVATLRRLLACESPAVAVSAARAILQGLPTMREHDELAARLEALEATTTTDGGAQP